MLKLFFVAFSILWAIRETKESEFHWFLFSERSASNVELTFSGSALSVLEGNVDIVRR